MPKLFPRLGGRVLAVVAATLAVTMFLPAQTASAAPATHWVLLNVDSSATANRTIDSVDVYAQDGSGGTDATFSGTVSFSATCGNCFAVSTNSDMSSPSNTYQFNPVLGDTGHKVFYVRWNESAVGAPQRLSIGGGGLTAADAANTTTVLSNNATKLTMTGPQTNATTGVPETITVTMKNAQDQTNPNIYAGTVTFTASCGPCFTITPNDGAGHLTEYTYSAADNSTKNFSLTWTSAGSARTFTATGTNLTGTPSVQKSGISVTNAPTTTTSSTSSTTTSSTTSSSTTSTTVMPRAKTTMLVTGAGPGGGPHVIARKASDPTQVVYSFYAYDPSFTGGVRVATGDVNNDGWDDIITAAGPGGGPHIKVFSGKDGNLLASFYAYDPTFTGGVFVAAGDVNGDGNADIITGADAGGGPHVRVFDGKQLVATTPAVAVVNEFMAYDPNFHGGVRVASADFNNDSRADVVTAPGPGGGPHVRVWSGASGAELGGAHGFYAYDPNFTGGVYLAATNAQQPLVITGAGPGGGRHVRVLDIHGAQTLGFMADPTSTQGAVPAFGHDSQNNNVFFVSRATGNPTVQRFDPTNGTQLSAFPAYGAAVGVFVAVGNF